MTSGETDTGQGSPGRTAAGSRSIGAAREGVTTPDFEVVAPNAAAMIESMRAVGYTPQAAIADLIDNSLSAKARNVWLTLFWDGASSYMAIRDDGHGMSEGALECDAPRKPQPARGARAYATSAASASGSRPHPSRSVAGLTVCSKAPGERPAFERWDLDYVNETEEWRLLKDAAPGSKREDQESG